MSSSTGETVIRPRSGWIAIDWRELWNARELLGFLVWRDVSVRYKQTVLGVAWAVLQPVFTMALENSSGTYWMRCDADDLYPPGRIRAQSHWLTENPSYGAICGGFTAIDSKGAMVSQLACDEASPRDVHWEMNRGILMTHLGTFAFRRQFYAAQRFREYFESAEDIDFMSTSGQARWSLTAWHLSRGSCRPD